MTKPSTHTSHDCTTYTSYNTVHIHTHITYYSSHILSVCLPGSDVQSEAWAHHTPRSAPQASSTSQPPHPPPIYYYPYILSVSLTTTTTTTQSTPHNTHHAQFSHSLFNVTLNSSSRCDSRVTHQSLSCHMCTSVLC